ncbi:hypothetical protein [Sulfitobacter sp. S190]|uniref:hypothetical protein n=1 Tax=Sulfitobacter sp. S190 TaxID=2867022 RepID=UPI0021A8E2A3|nr:hypothetical protein [Sulfitobacter sp. S190]UWR23314.1 hypothetical protein K3756_04795 [Sulfitobacter sp. S190]
MSTAAKEGFRWTLRRDTQADHDAVDQLISAWDLQSQHGLAQFFRLHLICFKAMATTSGDPRLPVMIDALSADLAVLRDAQDLEQMACPKAHPLAVDYILAGSRLGTQMLRKSWIAATDAQVRQAEQYFSIPPAPAEWQQTCAALDEIAPNSDEARVITHDSRALFGLFKTAYARIAL